MASKNKPHLAKGENKASNSKIGEKFSSLEKEKKIKKHLQENKTVIFAAAENFKVNCISSLKILKINDSAH